MRIKSFLGLPLYTSMTTLLTGCQLLAPYKGPVAPIPNQWKTNYPASSASNSEPPSDWKENPSSQPVSPPLKDLPEADLHITNAKNQPSVPQIVQENEPKAPSFEDARRDLGNWWEVFHDPVLNALEEQALNSSYTLWAALERVIQARTQASINFSPLLPGVNFNPQFSREGSLFENPFKNLTCPQAVPDPTNPLTNLPGDFRFIESKYLVPLNLTYEVDLWCQLRNSYYASIIRAQAASQAYLSVLLSLTADVASTYFQIRGFDAQQDVVQQTIRARQYAVDLNQARYKAGLIIYLDVSRAQVELARAHSDSDEVRRLRGLQENILATLVGTPASVFSLPYQPIYDPPPIIPDGIPSELLCRRPDIAEAERNLAAAYREIGVAYANFFPSLNLNATLGFESPTAHQLLNWQSRFWEVGWNVMQTVFDGGRNQANLEYYQSLFREALANYQQTVLQSFRDVEDSLVNLRQYAARARDLAIAVHAARVTLDLAQMRYDRGLTNYLDVVDAQRQLLETEQNFTIVLGNRYSSTVMLIRALGGGWGPCDTCSVDKKLDIEIDKVEVE